MFIVGTRIRDERFESVWGECDVRSRRYRFTINIEIHTQYSNLGEDVADFRFELEVDGSGTGCGNDTTLFITPSSSTRAI